MAIGGDLVAELQSFLEWFGIREDLVVRDTPSGDKVLYSDKGRLIPFVQNCFEKLYRAGEFGA